MCCCRKHEAGLISGSEMPGGPSLLGPLIYYVSGGQAPGGQLAEHRAGELVASSCAPSCHHASGQGSPSQGSQSGWPCLPLHPSDAQAQSFCSGGAWKHGTLFSGRSELRYQLQLFFLAEWPCANYFASLNLGLSMTVRTRLLTPRKDLE